MPAPRFSLLSVLIPCYNEEATIERTLDAVCAQRSRLQSLGLDLQIVTVDDASNDATYEQLQRRADAGDDGVIVAPPPGNRGEGAANRTARAHATGGHANT